ncbi:MAG: hypothetical protein J07HR59_01454 [Halorubrum sp. J07HR59]|nr:MAG: hypothetical protein J07HR59_01454 [Halorubrum sp. J07HR59]
MLIQLNLPANGTTISRWRQTKIVRFDTSSPSLDICQRSQSNDQPSPLRVAVRHTGVGQGAIGWSGLGERKLVCVIWVNVFHFASASVRLMSPRFDVVFVLDDTSFGFTRRHLICQVVEVVLHPGGEGDYADPGSVLLPFFAF